MSDSSAIVMEIPMVPTPKQSDRQRVIQPKSGKRAFAQHYQPKKVTMNASDLALFIARHRPPKPLLGPVAIVCEIDFQYRKSEKRSNIGKRIYKDTKPDCDNLKKQVCDVLQRLGFFKNDSQIASSRFDKYWFHQDRTAFRLWELSA